MSNYTKLFSSIVNSTIWREPNHVRIVWITMLALKDRDGLVEASIPGLADAARVSIDECEQALDRLMSPDRYSRTKDHEGRRIEEIQGGWKILNHEHYRLLESAEQRRAATAERVQRHRNKGQSVNSDNLSNVTEKRYIESEKRYIDQKVTLCNGSKRDVTDVTPSDTDQIRSDQIKEPPYSPPADADGLCAPVRDPTKPQPADPFRASFKTQCPDKLVFSEKHRGYAMRGSIDINLAWVQFREDARSKATHLVDWDAAFLASLTRSVERIERAAAIRATERIAQRDDATVPRTRQNASVGTGGPKPTETVSGSQLEANSKKLHSGLARIG